MQDHLDTDDDNDGFLDEFEIAYGSNPKDKNSISNAAPVDLRTTGSFSIEENAPAGTSVGYLRGIDPDQNAESATPQTHALDYSFWYWRKSTTGKSHFLNLPSLMWNCTRVWTF